MLQRLFFLLWLSLSSGWTFAQISAVAPLTVLDRGQLSLLNDPGRRLTLDDARQVQAAESPPALVKPAVTLPVGGKAVAVQLSWKHQFEYAAFYAAIEQGYYREAGLEVTLREADPGFDPIQEVLSGRADFGVANSGLIVEHARNKPVVALAALMQHSAFALLARRDRGIENVGDLDGKRVSCAAHACDEIRAYLTTSGLGEGHIRYVPLPSTNIAESLQISEATDIYTSNQGFQIIGHENEYVLFTPRSAGIDLYGDILFTSRERIAKAPQTVAAFRAATVKGLHYALTHQDELIQLILARYNTQHKSHEHLAYEAGKLYDLIRPDLVEPGYMSLGRWQHVRNVYARLGMLPADYPVETLLYQPETDRWPLWLRRILSGLSVGFVLTLLLSLYLRRINRRLKVEVSERAKAEASLQATQVSFQRFVEQANSLVAHELRTPLSVLQIHLDIIELKQSPDGACASNLSAMKQALRRLSELLEKNLKQVFVSTSFLSRQQRIDLGAMLEKCISDHAVLTHQSRVNLRQRSPGLVLLMAPEVLKTVVINLLDNAIKYSPPESGIDATAFQEEDFSVIEVSNSSSFPLPANPEVLFEKHTRGHADDAVPGTGIGLYLVRLIAEALGGHARILAEQPNCFTVQVHLPLAPPTTETLPHIHILENTE